MNDFDVILPDDIDPDDAEALREIWTQLGDLDDAAAPESSADEYRRALALGLRVATALAVPAGPEPTQRASGARSWVGPAIAASVALLLGSLAGVGIGRSTLSDGRVVQLESAVQELQLAQAFALMGNRSAPGRLRGVRLARSDVDDQTVRSWLLESATGDSNNNVRLAAIDAVLPHLSQADVQRRLLEALLVERSPLVQMALLDAFAAERVPALLPVLDELESESAERELAPEVRQRAQLARSVLQ